MDLQQIKVHLNDNPDLIVAVLEKIDCHHIKIIKNKRVQSALPYPSDNPTSISILLNDTLKTKIYTKNDFESYEIQDIFTLVQYITDCSLPEAVELICLVCNIKHTHDNSKKLISESYNFVKKYKRSLRNEEYIEDEVILDESFTQRFVREDCALFLDDGVDSQAQDKFGVSYDILDNRVVFPIRNDNGQLLSFKGRTCEEDYKINGIPKFISYYPCYNNNYLFGLSENHESIIKSNEIIIVEAEKSVMQLDSMGINNCVAISKKSISPHQLNKLFKLDIDTIILALDNDVTIEEIKYICNQFKRLKILYYIKDNSNLLKEKDSPSDCGKKVFESLLQNKIKFQEI